MLKSDESHKKLKYKTKINGKCLLNIVNFCMHEEFGIFISLFSK